MKTAVNIFWFRRDLRLTDNAGLFHALNAGLPVLPVFIFDRNILDLLPDKKDPRVEFIYHTIQSLHAELVKISGGLDVYYGHPSEVFNRLADSYQVDKVFCNEDYEPYARTRDADIEKLIRSKGGSFHAYKDQVIFSKNEVLKTDGTPYTIFTPYSNTWKALLNSATSETLKRYPSEKKFQHFYKQPGSAIPELSSMGFSPSGRIIPPLVIERKQIAAYGAKRDFPGLDASSRLGIHLRFGTLSIRQLVTETKEPSPVFLNELIWRDFYQMILWHFPRVGQGRAFKPAYEEIPWRNNEVEFDRWCKGKTGYPMVDAGMRQLNQTGFMHNRVRMVTASFLAKHLLIDWRWGEAYFAEKLLDFDLASNNGGWQWAAGCGCDAAPYFRVFNPSLQQKKFDPQLTYINKWLPDLQELDYPRPIVDHDFARLRAIRVYKETLDRKGA